MIKLSDLLWVLPVLGGAGITVPFLYQVSKDRRKTSLEQSQREAQLLAEMQTCQQCNHDLWAALRPARYDQVLDFYVRGGATKQRVDYVLTFWNKVGQLYFDGHVNRKRFLPQIVPLCHGTWNDFSKLLEYFEVTQPARINYFRKLREAVLREVATRRRLDSESSSRSRR